MMIVKNQFLKLVLFIKWIKGTSYSSPWEVNFQNYCQAQWLYILHYNCEWCHNYMKYRNIENLLQFPFCLAKLSSEANLQRRREIVVTSDYLVRPIRSMELAYNQSQSSRGEPASQLSVLQLDFRSGISCLLASDPDKISIRFSIYLDSWMES